MCVPMEHAVVKYDTVRGCEKLGGRRGSWRWLNGKVLGKTGMRRWVRVVKLCENGYYRGGD